MNATNEVKLPPPPGVLNSLRTGLDVVSSHVWLVALPVLFDLFLWLGPRLIVKDIFSPIAAELIKYTSTRPIQEVTTVDTFVEYINFLNWASFIRTFPIGIFSLEAYAPIPPPILTPLGEQIFWQASSIWIVFGWLILFTLVGWVGGSLYFRSVAVAALGEEEAGIPPLRAIIQTVILSVVWLVAFMFVFIPVTFVTGALSAINPMLATSVMLILVFFSYWIIVPIFFMPHGIFVRKQNALNSILSGFRMTRITLPTSGLFVLSVFLLTRGLNYLWNVPGNDSWMVLVGIAGHAVIVTTVLAASFVYYRDMMAWLQHAFQQAQAKPGTPTRQV